ncbi:MAG: hemerythrin domain-containing protein [Gammaproteobacteria bacterium]|nr:hemerythrin domain-containing protein [Gammaproteobacteria bacterium]MDH3467443.1 hemerythrin domain-containing protein [Gammaproteobacteria bacterium]
MSDIMQQLHLDHRNVATMLNILEKHLKAVRELEVADIELMHDVMVYMTSYPDRVHHPMEDFVFQRVKEKCSTNHEVLGVVEREHQELSSKGKRFREMLDHVVDGSMVLREELESAGSDYVASLRRHMAIEDSKAFPLAERVLEADDWAWVASQMQATQDPVFGAVVAEQFATLRRYITEQSE